MAWTGLWVLLAGGVARMVFAAFREKRLWPFALVVALYALALLVMAELSGNQINFDGYDIISANTSFIWLDLIVGRCLLDWLPAWPVERQLLVSWVVLGPLAVAPALLATLLGPALTVPAGQRAGQAAAALLLACRKNALPLMMAWCLGLALFFGETVCMDLLPWPERHLIDAWVVCAPLFNALFFLWLIAGALAVHDMFPEVAEPDA